MFCVINFLDIIRISEDVKEVVHTEHVNKEGGWCDVTRLTHLVTSLWCDESPNSSAARPVAGRPRVALLANLSSRSSEEGPCECAVSVQGGGPTQVEGWLSPCFIARQPELLTREGKGAQGRPRTWRWSCRKVALGKEVESTAPSLEASKLWTGSVHLAGRLFSFYIIIH